MTAPVVTIPETARELVVLQWRIGSADVAPWTCPDEIEAIAGCFVCFERGKEGAGSRGDPGWAAAALLVRGAADRTAVVRGLAGAPYEAGVLALREGRLLADAVRALGDVTPEVLLVNATGRDHPRRAGLAVHLGALLAVPTVGVTHRPLFAEGAWPPDEEGARSPLLLDGEMVGVWLRTRAGTRPLAVHAGWRTSSEVAADVVRRVAGRARTPGPIRVARQAARVARASTS